MHFGATPAIPISLLVLATTYYFFGAGMVQLCSSVTNGIPCDVAIPVLVVLIPLIIGFIVDNLLPFKHGPLHGILPAIVFSASLALVSYLLFKISLFLALYMAATTLVVYLLNIWIIEPIKDR